LLLDLCLCKTELIVPSINQQNLKRPKKIGPVLG
jgi:hypothetical protein